MAIYREQIEKAIERLLQEGFSVESVLESEKNFGDTEIILAGKSSKLRFISDRGQIFVDIAKIGSQDWQDLHEALNHINVKNSPGPWLSAAEAVQKIQMYSEDLSLT